MKIWVDYSDIISWPHPHLTGIQRVVVEVGHALLSLHENVGYFSFHPDSGLFRVVDPASLSSARVGNVKSIRVTEEEAVFSPGDRIYLLGGTWVHPGFVVALQALKKKSDFLVAQFVHDVTPIRVPHFHRDKSREIMQRWLTELSPLVDVYLTNSEFSRREIEGVFKEYNLVPKKFKVVRLGDQLPAEAISSTPERFKQLPGDFILCVGSFEPRKNHLLLYQAWHLWKQAHGDSLPTLVIVGRAGWQSEDLKALIFRDPELARHFVWAEHASESELVWLYKSCLFTVYPSFYEGWGLPVAESLSYGKFCVASSAASIPEIAGTLIDYFNPYNSQECYERILKVWMDRSYLAQRQEEVKLRYRLTSWSESARQCLELATEG